MEIIVFLEKWKLFMMASYHATYTFLIMNGWNYNLSYLIFHAEYDAENPNDPKAQTYTLNCRSATGDMIFITDTDTVQDGHGISEVKVISLFPGGKYLSMKNVPSIRALRVNVNWQLINLQSITSCEAQHMISAKAIILKILGGVWNCYTTLT